MPPPGVPIPAAGYSSEAWSATARNGNDNGNGNGNTNTNGPHPRQVYVNALPPARPLVPKRIQRRSPYACDECRLRKRACDAAKPCGPCRRSRTECSYQFRRPSARPTTTIRALQGHLRQARDWLQQVQAKLPDGVPGLDLDACLRTLDSTLRDQDEPPSSSASSQPSAATETDSPTKARPSLSMQDSVRAGRSMFCYGPLSDASFILHMVHMLQVVPPDSENPENHDNHEFMKSHQLLDDLIDPPLKRKFSDGHNDFYAPFSPRDIPQDTPDLLDVVLERRELMLCFLPEHELKTIAEKSRAENFSSACLSLLHMVLALAYLYDSKRHMTIQCDTALCEAIKHFETGAVLITLTDAPDESLLPALLCAAVFLLSLSRTTHAQSFISKAGALAIRLELLSDPSSSSEKLPFVDRQRRWRLIASLLCLDRAVAIILDLPTCLPEHSISAVRLTRMADQAEAEDDLLTASLCRCATLLAIPLSDRSFSSPDDHSNGRTRQAGLFQSALQGFQRWSADAASLMAKLTSSTQDQNLQRIKKVLEISYHLGHIILFRPHLQYVRDMYAGKRISLAESYYALACIKVASSVILLAESMTPDTDSWLTTHAVFSSVTCLVFLVAAHPATTLPSTAWQRACRGIKIIAASRCSDNLSAISLEALKVVTHKLRQTIYIDFAQIEALVGSKCHRLASRVTTSGNADLGEAMPVGSYQGHFGEISDDNRNRTEGLPVENEADKMLQQAEMLEEDMSFLDWLGNDGSPAITEDGLEDPVWMPVGR